MAWLIMGGFKKELKERTESLLTSLDEMRKSLERNSRITKKQLDLGIPFANEVIPDLVDSLKQLKEAEQKLDASVHEHIQFIQELINKLTQE